MYYCRALPKGLRTETASKARDATHALGHETGRKGMMRRRRRKDGTMSRYTALLTRHGWHSTIRATSVDCASSEALVRPSDVAGDEIRRPCRRVREICPSKTLPVPP
ncbi:unnamed protein product [Prorocentrum cordatum]|uniref:Uncharacterized protein n=1 Tax=Prorocentrum cordatum TaxID=2364126 RepID=A0ABN9RIY1_9DINO|nr:unnamed protein product [Polarella glacialis]